VQFLSILRFSFMSFDMDDVSGTASIEKSYLFKYLKEGTVFEIPELVRLYGRGFELVNLIHQRLSIAMDGQWKVFASVS
jgi:hypothetical protein